MLKVQNRVSLANKIVFKNSLSSPFFTVRYSTTDSGILKAGFVISKKIDSRAVGRNKIKRILSHAVVPFLQTLKNRDMVFYVKPAIKNQSKEAITREVQDMIYRINTSL